MPWAWRRYEPHRDAPEFEAALRERSREVNAIRDAGRPQPGAPAAGGGGRNRLQVGEDEGEVDCDKVGCA